ncbi:MAG: UDP-3-O-(3-hydroxymyristoyl)glucosamine N-acyltransferase [Micrococcales bacterium]|nr:UDP-3-O-(3-hydroxymyristoyl)glucosamine N-acyltransferase [Micrococcales bacterium]
MNTTTIGSCLEVLRTAGWLDEVVERVPGLDAVISRTAPLPTAEPDAVTFATSSVGADDVAATRAGLVLLQADSGHAPADFAGARVVAVAPRSRLAHALVLGELLAPRPAAGVHPSAVVDPSAVIADDVSIGPLCYVGPDVTIGSGSRLDAGAKVLGPAVLGERVWLQSGVVIGSHAFSFERAPDGTVVRVPQLGGVHLHDDVEIGANAVVDRGGSGDTEIHRGAKVGHLSVVGHNVQLGEGTFIIGLGGVAGSSVVGRDVWVGPLAMVRDHVTVGDGTFIAMGGAVTKNVPAGTKVLPARSTYRVPDEPA